MIVAEIRIFMQKMISFKIKKQDSIDLGKLL